MPLPRAVADELQFNLGIEHRRQVVVESLAESATMTALT